jgi:D-aminopeptidase
MTKSLLVLFDAEGATGIKYWKDVTEDFHTDKPTKKLRKALAGDINSVLKGAKKAGIDNVYLLDWHSSGNNISKDELNIPSGLNVVLKTETIKLLRKYSKKSDFAVLIGMHGAYGTNDRAPPIFEDEFKKETKTGLAHSFVFSINKLYLNGVSRGEAVVLMHILRDLGIPVILVSGSKAATDEVNRFSREIDIVATKNGKNVYPAERVRMQLTKKTANVIINAFSGKGYVKLDNPKFEYHSFSIEFKHYCKKRHKKKIKHDLTMMMELGDKKLKLKGHSVNFITKTRKPYFENYKFLSKAYKYLEMTEYAYHEFEEGE